MLQEVSERPGSRIHHFKEKDSSQSALVNSETAASKEDEDVVCLLTNHIVSSCKPSLHSIKHTSVVSNLTCVLDLGASAYTTFEKEAFMN